MTIIVIERNKLKNRKDKMETLKLNYEMVFKTAKRRANEMTVVDLEDLMIDGRSRLQRTIATYALAIKGWFLISSDIYQEQLLSIPHPEFNSLEDLKGFAKDINEDYSHRYVIFEY
jgi:hypothetical protein